MVGPKVPAGTVLRSASGPWIVTAYQGIAHDQARTTALDSDIADLARRHSSAAPTAGMTAEMEWEYLLLTARKS